MDFKQCLQSSYQFASSAGDSLSATSIAIVHVDAFTNLTLKAKQLRECLDDCGVTMLGAFMNHFLSITMDTAEKVCCVDRQPTLLKVTHMKSCTQIRWTCNCRNPRSKCKMQNINFCVVYLENVN
jgi:hypothetical protein